MMDINVPVTAIFGELGIGKTAELSRMLYEYYKDGCLCVANYAHVYAHIQMRDPALTIELIRQLGEFKRRGYEACDLLPTFQHTGIGLFIDEAHLTAFSPDLKSTSEQMQSSLQFISMARKQDVSIFLVTQDPALLAKTVRRYVGQWLYLSAVIPWFKHIYVPHPTRPTFRREKRIVFPLIRYEYHALDYENPIRNYSKRIYDRENGYTEYTEQCTLIGRAKWRWAANAFIHSLYDSHEMVGMSLDLSKQENFDLLKTIAYIEHTKFPERYPTFKGLWEKLTGRHILRTDELQPVRLKIKNLELPTGVTPDMASHVIKQPEQFLDDISFFLDKSPDKKFISKYKKTGNIKVSPSPSPT